MREHFTRIAPFRENGPEMPSASHTFYLALFCWEKEAAGLEATRGCRLETRRGDGAGPLITGLSHSPLRGFCRLKLLLTHGPIPFVRFHGAAASPGAWSRGPADTLPAPVCGQIRNKFNPLVATTLSFEAKCAPCFGLARYKIIVARRFHLLVVSGRPSKRRFCYDPVFIGKGSQGGRVLARVEGSKV